MWEYFQRTICSAFAIGQTTSFCAKIVQPQNLGQLREKYRFCKFFWKKSLQDGAHIGHLLGWGVF